MEKGCFYCKKQNRVTDIGVDDFGVDDLEASYTLKSIESDELIESNDGNLIDDTNETKKPYDPENLFSHLSLYNQNNDAFTYEQNDFLTWSLQLQHKKFIFNEKTILLYCAFKADLVLRRRNEIVKRIVSYDFSVSVDWSEFIYTVFGKPLKGLIREVNPNQMVLFMRLFDNQNGQYIDETSLFKVGAIARIYYCIEGYQNKYPFSEWQQINVGKECSSQENKTLEKLLRDRITFYTDRFKEVTGEKMDLKGLDEARNGDIKLLKHSCQSYLDAAIKDLKKSYCDNEETEYEFTE